MRERKKEKKRPKNLLGAAFSKCGIVKPPQTRYEKDTKPPSLMKPFRLRLGTSYGTCRVGAQVLRAFQGHTTYTTLGTSYLLHSRELSAVPALGGGGGLLRSFLSLWFFFGGFFFAFPDLRLWRLGLARCRSGPSPGPTPTQPFLAPRGPCFRALARCILFVADEAGSWATAYRSDGYSLPGGPWIATARRHCS